MCYKIEKLYKCDGCGNAFFEDEINTIADCPTILCDDCLNEALKESEQDKIAYEKSL